MSIKDTNPEKLFGGTWVAWGTGRVPVGVDDADDDFKDAEKTGGEKAHVMSTREIPSHNHSVNAVDIASSGAHTHTASKNIWVSQTDKNMASGTSTGRTTTTNIVNSGGTHTHTVPSHNTNYSGGGAAHNNLQPYITCYMWKRIG